MGEKTLQVLFQPNRLALPYQAWSSQLVGAVEDPTLADTISHLLRRLEKIQDVQLNLSFI